MEGQVVGVGYQRDLLVVAVGCSEVLVEEAECFQDLLVEEAEYQRGLQGVAVAHQEDQGEEAECQRDLLVVAEEYQRGLQGVEEELQTDCLSVGLSFLHLCYLWLLLVEVAEELQRGCLLDLLV